MPPCFRRSPVLVAGLAVLLAACDRAPANGADVAPSADVPTTLDTVARGLAVPWGIAFAPDGRVFVTERPGAIRVVIGDSLVDQPWASLPVHNQGEAGLMGIAVAPDFATSRHVFVVGTFSVGTRMVNRVVRLTDRDGAGVEPTTIVDGIPAGPLHAGDAIAFGPDGMLYVATGDAQDPGDAADVRSLAGKILRYTPAGSIPADNPVAGSPVYARGFRNPQGLAWDAAGRLLVIDHGPSGFANERFRRDNDELNVVRAGADHGWPAVAGVSRISNTVAPLVAWTPAIAPAGIAVMRSRDFPEWADRLVVGGLVGEQLRLLSVAGDSVGLRLLDTRVLATGGVGRIRAVATAPDGALYFTTSNRDGRGAPRPGDDHIFRLRRARH